MRFSKMRMVLQRVEYLTEVVGVPDSKTKTMVY